MSNKSNDGTQVGCLKKMETLKLAENSVQFTSMSCNTKQKPSKTKHARYLVPREWIVMTYFKQALKN